MDSLYAFKCKRLSNTRHTVTFRIPCKSLFETTYIIIGSHIELKLSLVKLCEFSYFMTFQNTVHIP
jgi:hypothetical protein